MILGAVIPPVHVSCTKPAGTASDKRAFDVPVPTNDSVTSLRGLMNVHTVELSVVPLKSSDTIPDVGTAFTVNPAALLVTEFTLLVTTQRKLDPLSVCTVAGVVYDAAVAPLMFTVFFCH
jgi:hypothetical protein